MAALLVVVVLFWWVSFGVGDGEVASGAGDTMVGDSVLGAFLVVKGCSGETVDGFSNVVGVGDAGVESSTVVVSVFFCPHSKDI